MMDLFEKLNRIEGILRSAASDALSTELSDEDHYDVVQDIRTQLREARELLLNTLFEVEEMV